MWDLPRPGLEPVSPAPAGRLSTTAPPGKPASVFYVLVFRPRGMWDRSSPTRPGIELAPPALEGEVLTTGLPGKSPPFTFLKFIYLWLCWVFISVRGLSPVAASGDHSSSRCAGLSLSCPLLLRSTGSRHAGLVIVAYGPSCSAACGILPDQGSNPCPLH